MNARSQISTRPGTAYERGQRLYCPRCGSEVEILNPSNTTSPSMILLCCGEEMRATTEVAVHLSDAL
jgi:hypothetical protein